MSFQTITLLLSRAFINTPQFFTTQNFMAAVINGRELPVAIALTKTNKT
jgi:hypothetical protein